MEALRLVLHQSSANYRREGTVDNKMTYPLPPPSTVIGALHSACGFKEYHPMDISIQGKYESMHREPYTDYCFLNSTMDDRGILVKMRNADMLSTAFDRVASAKKSQGNSFRNRVTIQVHNEELLEEYLDLKNLADKIKDFKDDKLKKILELIKRRKSRLSQKKASVDKNSDLFHKYTNREKEIKEREKWLKEQVKAYEMEHYQKPVARFKSLTTSLKYYEILNNIDLVIHIRAERKVLEMLMDNIYNLKSIGRSEDFVSVEDAKIVNLVADEWAEETESGYSAYLNFDDLLEDRIFGLKAKPGDVHRGTKYLLNKVYKIENQKRIFEKKWVFYVSEYAVNETSENVLLDKEDDCTFIVNFV